MKFVIKNFKKNFNYSISFILLFITIANVLYQIFEFELIPLFKSPLDTIHFWGHKFIFSWVSSFLNYIANGLIWLYSQLLSIIPWRIHCEIPELLTDFSLVSLALTRVFNSADLYVPRSARAKAEDKSTPEELENIYKVEGKFWGSIHKFLEYVNEKIWGLLSRITSSLNKIFKNAIMNSFLEKFFKSLAGIFLFWGFIRISGYIINGIAARKLRVPIMGARKKLMKFYWINLLGAIALAFLFFILNFLLLD